MKNLKSKVPSLKNPQISPRGMLSRSPFPSVPIRSYPFKFAVMATAALLLAGCATETLAQGITTKNTSGNGTVIDSHIGINTDTKIPELRTVFISGDIATVKAGTNQVSYREESSSSIWNASSVTKKRFLAITLTDAGDVPAAIKAVAEVFKTAEATAAAAEAKAAEPAAAAKTP